MKKSNLKVLIVDDESLARERISMLLANFADVKIVAECASGVEAVAAIEKHEPDLMFLDMQMPEMDGMSVINSQADKQTPLVIFVTAYDKYGLAAFDSNAVDYLLKPFDQKRFEKAIEKARVRLSENNPAPINLPGVVSRIELQANYRKHIAIRQDGRVFLLKTEKIEWIEAERNYIRLHAGQESHLRHEGIGNVEKQLDPTQFRRVHRSAIVNLNFIKELRSVSGGDYQIILLNERELVLSQTYQKNLPEFLG